MSIQSYLRTTQGSKKLSDNFSASEFACFDGSNPFFVDDALVEVLQSIRTHFGKAVKITSAYRNAAHNDAVGGSPNSQHLRGMAADIQVSGVTPATVAAYAETLLPDCGGIGTYSSFTHVDVRTSKSRWKG